MAIEHNAVPAGCATPPGPFVVSHVAVPSTRRLA